MTTVEIVLLLIGCVLMIGSFFIAERLSPSELDKVAELSESELAKIIEKELKGTAVKIDETIEGRIELLADNVDRALEKETNEKIMAINEYSDTVIQDMNKTHNEIMFLYSMLNDKHTEMTGMASDLQRLAADIRSLHESIQARLPQDMAAKARPGAAKSGVAAQLRTAAKSGATAQLQEAGQLSATAQLKAAREEIAAAQAGVAATQPAAEAVAQAGMSAKAGTVAQLTSAGQLSATGQLTAGQLTGAGQLSAAAQLNAAREKMAEPIHAGAAGDAGNSDKDNHNAEILDLHRQGLNEVEIAKRLGLGIGEVRLVIGLYREDENA